LLCFGEYAKWLYDRIDSRARVHITSGINLKYMRIISLLLVINKAYSPGMICNKDGPSQMT